MKKFLFIALLLCLMACVAVASAEGLILKDAEGNVLEKGATLSGHYYYKVYVEGVPEEYEGIQTAWMRDVLDAEDHDEWEAIRYLHEDEIGRYILIVPVVGAEYIQETMFARLDENDTNITQINFTYDRETVKETDPPTLISEDDPKVGEENYLLQWNPVEGAEFYEVLWYTPSENVFYYGVFLAALVGLWRQLKSRTLNAGLLLPLFFLGLTLAHMLVEVSDRYHYSLIPILILFAAVGFARQSSEQRSTP